MMHHSLFFLDAKCFSRELRGSPPTSALKRGATPIDLYQNVWSGMTQNDINAAKLRYFTEFSR